MDRTHYTERDQAVKEREIVEIASTRMSPVKFFMALLATIGQENPGAIRYAPAARFGLLRVRTQWSCELESSLTSGARRHHRLSLAFG